MPTIDETKPIYLETDVPTVGLGPGLLQTREGTDCSRDEASDNSTLRPVTFESKRLSAAEKRYSNKETNAIGILHSLKKFALSER